MSLKHGANQKKHILVGGFNPSEKILVNWDDYSLWKNKKCSEPPTSITYLAVNSSTFLTLWRFNIATEHGPSDVPF